MQYITVKNRYIFFSLFMTTRVPHLTQRMLLILHLGLRHRSNLKLFRSAFRLEEMHTCETMGGIGSLEQKPRVPSKRAAVGEGVNEKPVDIPTSPRASLSNRSLINLTFCHAFRSEYFRGFSIITESNLGLMSQVTTYF